MKKLPRFWNALTEVPNATADALEWRELLGPEWDFVSVFFKPTGRVVDRVSCPAPGGAGCPRKVLRRADGSLKAVCGQRFPECDSLSLTAAEITVLGLNRKRLIRAIATALHADAVSGRSDGNWAQVGKVALTGSTGVEVLLVLPEGQSLSPQPPWVKEDFVLMLVPTQAIAREPAVNDLQARGIAVACLVEDVVSSSPGAFELVGGLERHLASFRWRIKSEGETVVWTLPVGTQWGDLTFTLTASETLTVNVGNQARAFDPDALGMRNRRTGAPKEAWGFLQVLATFNGVLTWRDKAADDTFVKRKQELCRHLSMAFGLPGEPVHWRNGEYRTAFVIRDGRSKAERDRG